MIPPDIPIQENKYHHAFAITNKQSWLIYKVFIDEDSMHKYKAFKDNKHNNMVADLQHQGKCLPILKTHCNTYSAFKKGYLSVDKFSPPAIGDTFSTKKHGNPYSRVIKHTHLKYTKFEVELPEGTVMLYKHRRFPIVDFVHKEKRFRWLYYSDYRARTGEYKYTYSLFEIDEYQPSLVDDLVDGEVNKNNLLIGSTVKNIFSKSNFKRNYDVESFVSTKKICQIRYLNRQKMFGSRPTAVFEFSSDQEIESIKDVTPEVMRYLTMALIFKMEQDIKENNRQAAIALAWRDTYTHTNVYKYRHI